MARNNRRNRNRNSKVRKPSPFPEPLLGGPLPGWYYRVSRLVATRRRCKDVDDDWSDHGPHPRDFDEDLSEIGPEDTFTCHCSSDTSECECEFDDFDLPDEELYYEYREMREERKEKIAQRRKLVERSIEFQKEREEEVEKAWTKAKERETQGKKGRRLNLKSAHFRIYSSDFIRSLPLFHDQGTTYIEFYTLGEQDNSSDSIRLNGHLYFNGCNSPDLAAFRAPKRTGTSGVSIDIQNSDAKITVTFIDRDFVKVAIPRHVVQDKQSLANGPEVMEFCGISLDREKKAKRKREEQEEGAENKKQRQREVSPRESWFEMNHPMGWWAQNHGF